MLLYLAKHEILEATD